MKRVSRAQAPAGGVMPERKHETRVPRVGARLPDNVPTNPTRVRGQWESLLVIRAPRVFFCTDPRSSMYGRIVHTARNAGAVMSPEVVREMQRGTSRRGVGSGWRRGGRAHEAKRARELVYAATRAQALSIRETAAKFGSIGAQTRDE